MTNLEKLLADGAESCHPQLIGVVDGKRQYVGNFVHNNEFQLTDYGIKRIAQLAELDKPAPKKKVKEVIDLDLDV